VVITGPLTVGALAGGGAALAIGHATDDKDAKEIGGFIFGTAFDAAAEGLGAATLNPGAPLLAKGVKEFCGVYNAAGDFLDPTSRGMPGPDQRAKIAGYLIKNL
jgi:hypothetical protein